MSLVATNGGWSRAALLALLMLLPGTHAVAQGRPFTLPSVTDALGSPARQLALEVPPMRLRFGVAQDDQVDEQALLRPFPSSNRGAPVRIRAPFQAVAAPTRESMVECPMPVVRRDSSAVSAMPRLDPPLGDTGGVTVPSCRNPLDTP